jgi:hypothetical protein
MEQGQPASQEERLSAQSAHKNTALVYTAIVYAQRAALSLYVPTLLNGHGIAGRAAFQHDRH